MKFKSNLTILFLGLVLSQICLSQTINTWTTSSGSPVRSSDGNCVGNSYASPQTSAPECLGAKVDAKKQVSAPPITLKGDALFDFNKSTLKPRGVQLIQALVNKVKLVNYASILITGHTDNIGSEKYNNKLSLKRAEAIKALFVKNGIDASKIRLEGKGFSEPIADNKTASGRAQNRRAVIKIDQIH